MVYGATWQAGAGKLMGSLNVLTAYPLAALAALVTLHWRVTCTAYFVTSSKVPGRRCCQTSRTGSGNLLSGRE